MGCLLSQSDGGQASSDGGFHFFDQFDATGQCRLVSIPPLITGLAGVVSFIKKCGVALYIKTFADS